MPVILTSFKNASSFTGISYSISPLRANLSMPKLQFLIPSIPPMSAGLLTGNSMKRIAQKQFKAQWADISKFLISLDNSKTYILCCSCPHDKDSADRIKVTGDFICHSGLIGRMIMKYRSDIDIVLDDERLSMLSNDVKPSLNKCDYCDMEQGDCFDGSACAGPYRVTGSSIEAYNLRLRFDSGC